MNKLPLLFFALLLVFFAVPLLRGKDPALLESAMIGRPVPTFDMPAAVKKGKGFSSKDLQKTPSVVNVFASWCLTCQIEQKALGRMAAAENIPLYGLNYKDTPAALEAWLKRHGNPYTAIGADTDGHVAIDWGVYGVPETFVVDAKGIIRFKYVGVITDDVYKTVFKPLLAELKK